MVYDIDPTQKSKGANEDGDDPVVGKPRKFKELQKVMMEDDDYDEEDYDDEEEEEDFEGNRSVAQRAKRTKRARKGSPPIALISNEDLLKQTSKAGESNKGFESGSEEEFVPGHTIKLGDPKDGTLKDTSAR